MILPLKIMKQIAFLFLSIFALASCKTLVNTIPADKLPQGDPKITMFCYISPQDTVIRAKVRMSSPAFEEIISNGQSFYIQNGDTIRTNQPLTTATVIISDGSSTARLKYQNQTQTFDIPTSEFPIRAGGTYLLTVTNGGQSACASCTVPANSVPVKAYVLDSVKANQFGDRGTKLTLNFTWDDPAGVANFYRMRVYEVIDSPAFRTNVADSTVTEYRQRYYNYFRIDRNNLRQPLQNDKSLDGTTFSSPQFESYSLLNTYGGEIFVFGKLYKAKRGPERIGLFIELMNADKPYYDFHRSLEECNEDNPFTEPSLLYSNVQGGLGVFASFNKKLQSIRL